MFRAKVGIVGAGFVGRHLIKLLKNFDLAGIWVHNPYLNTEEAVLLGVEKKAWRRCFQPVITSVFVRLQLLRQRE